MTEEEYLRCVELANSGKLKQEKHKQEGEWDSIALPGAKWTLELDWAGAKTKVIFPDGPNVPLNTAMAVLANGRFNFTQTHVK